MTTWDDCAYNTDFHAFIATKLPKDEELFKQFIQKYPLKISTLDGIQASTYETKEDISLFRKLFPRTHDYQNEYMIKEILKMSEKYTICHTGIKAVYKMFHICWEELVSYESTINFKHMFETQEKFISHSSFVSYNTPKRIGGINEMLNLPPRQKHYYTRYMSLSSTMHHLGYFHRTRSYTDAVDKARRNNEDWPTVKDITLGKDIEIKLFESTVAIGVKMKEGKYDFLVLLETRSLRRLIMMLRSLAKLAVHYIHVTQKTNNSNSFNAFLRYMNILSDAMWRTNRENELARMCDIIYYMKLSEISSDLTNRSQMLQKEKFTLEKGEEVISSSEILESVSKLKIFDAIDVLKTYKILPCPDFDPTTGFINNANNYKNQWTFGKLPEGLDNNDLKITVDDFKLYQKLQMIKRFHNVHGVCPGSLNNLGLDKTLEDPFFKLSTYPNISPSKISLNDLCYVDINGSGIWEPWNTNVPSHYTDKASPPQHIGLRTIQDGTAYNELPITHRNYLGFYMNETDIPPTDALRFSYANGYYPYEQRADFKPESKKPNPRNFFSAKPYSRLIRAEFEDNVSRYLNKDDSSVTGKSPDKIEIQTAKILRTRRHGKQRVFISFDLEKFSPKMPEEASYLANKVWIDFFKQPYLDSVWKQYQNNELHFFHHGIHQRQNAHFTDLEGQMGKVNTAFHIDLMAYTVRQLRKMKLIEDPGSLFCLIDDGLLAIDIEKDELNKRLKKIMDIIESVYYFFGCHISWDKTFISSKMAMFLNEVWYSGTKYAGGVKAILKMQPQKLQDELSFLGKIKGLISMAQGCVKTGLNAHLAAAELFRECYIMLDNLLPKTMSLKKHDPISTSLLFMMPISLGGLGIPTPISLMGVMGTVSLRLFCDQINYTVKAFPAATDTFLPLLKQQMRIRRDIDVLRNPGGVRREMRTLTEWKHIPYLADAIKESVNNRSGQFLLNLNKEHMANQVLSVITMPASEEDIYVAYKSSPLSAYDDFLGKFKRANTILNFLSRRDKVRIIGKYATEARSVVDETFAYIRSNCKIVT